MNPTWPDERERGGDGLPAAFGSPSRRAALSRRALLLAPFRSDAVFAKTVAAVDAASLPATPLCREMVCARFVSAEQWGEWTLDTEVAGIEHARQRARIDRVDLVGYSGGGAAALAYAVAHPEVIASLTLIEPPWIGNDLWSEEEARFRDAYEQLYEAAEEEVWSVAAAILNAPETPAPRSLPVEPGALREALLGVWQGYQAAPLDRRRLRHLDVPVYLPVGEGSAPRMRAQAQCLQGCFPSARMEMFPGASHFDLPVVGARQLAQGLARTWGQASL